MDAIKSGDRVVIADDLLATGGTASAAAALIRSQGAELAAAAFIVTLESLNGAKAINPPCQILSLFAFP